jgi:hypothetical protein
MNSQGQFNEAINQIIQSLVSRLYSAMTTKDGQTFSAFLEFDDQQRISQINNPLVNGEIKTPDFKLIEELNRICEKINSLPDMYKLKSLDVAVSADLQVKMIPTYLS